MLVRNIISLILIATSSIGYAQEEKEYTVDDLMGKSSVSLFGKDINLRKEAYDAFLAMRKAAYNDGIEIKIASSYRNFNRQQEIWERKYITYTNKGLSPAKAIDKIIEYSTIPGTSRHHWGTEIDIIQGRRKTKLGLLNPKNFEEGGAFHELYQWMDKNASTYGFYIVYTKNKRRKGFKYEPWHYSYAPISIPMLKAYRNINLMRIYQDENFEGHEHLSPGFMQNYIRNHILDINPTLL